MAHTQRLREIAKFVAGLVAADLLTGLWLLGSGTLPQTYFGMWITVQTAWVWVIFDLLVLLLLIHYGWNHASLEPRPSSKALSFVSGTIMGAVAIVHLLRLLFNWSIVINGWIAPIWVSWVGVIVAGYISYASFHFATKRGKRNPWK